MLGYVLLSVSRRVTEQDSRAHGHRDRTHCGLTGHGCNDTDHCIMFHRNKYSSLFESLTSLLNYNQQKLYQLISSLLRITLCYVYFIKQPRQPGHRHFVANDDKHFILLLQVVLL